MHCVSGTKGGGSPVWYQSGIRYNGR
uniref:Uncharacterized protein n=1 Tax=Arundo donax TaxID=35708 RepID=A0A0A9CAC0_ARUDO